MILRLLGGAAALAILASACGGTAQPAASAAAQATVAATAAPTVAATTAPTVAPSPTKPVVPATGQGSTSAKLTENKFEFKDGAAPDLPAGMYLSTVSLVTLEKGGRTAAHKHGGVESIYVLEGTVDFRTATGGRIILKAGQGASVAPNTPLQAVNGGDTVAKFLAFFVTQETAPFQTAVNDAP